MRGDGFRTARQDVKIKARVLEMMAMPRALSGQRNGAAALKLVT
jgi:hypothetical protein